MRPPTLCILALIVGCNHAASVQTTTTTPADQIQLAHVGKEWDADGNFLAVVRLTNCSAADICYAGYGTASPTYTQQMRASDLDGWLDQKSGWCGVGLGMQHLPAGQSATFTVPPPDASQSWRIGIKLEPPQAQEIWTQPIIANPEMAREAPGAADLVQTDVSRHPDREFPYTFTLKNVSRTLLFYGGYQEPHVPPIYLIQEKRSEGWQDKGKADWSGTGFGFKELPPGGSISLSIPAQSLDARLGESESVCSRAPDRPPTPMPTARYGGRRCPLGMRKITEIPDGDRADQRLQSRFGPLSIQLWRHPERPAKSKVTGMMQIIWIKDSHHSSRPPLRVSSRLGVSLSPLIQPFIPVRKAAKITRHETTSPRGGVCAADHVGSSADMPGG